MFKLFKKRREPYRSREEWSYFIPFASEYRKKRLKALRNQRYYDKHKSDRC